MIPLIERKNEDNKQFPFAEELPDCVWSGSLSSSASFIFHQV